jgi:hydrogenase nickel incorporation protein HypB
MCTTCGCSPGPFDLHEHGSDHAHDHPDGAHHHHHHEHAPSLLERVERSPAVLRLEHNLLARNDEVAARNRRWLEQRGILALNLVSSPGAGKTTLLESTIGALGGEVPIAVIEGDQETERDAERIRAKGCRAIQINTGAGCHLDATMIERVLPRLELAPGSVLFIENVGNLVCPALFDLGERAKVVVASVTEGEDKPLKYPHMFRASRLMLLNKVDLLPHVDFDVAKCLEHARQVNPGMEVMRLSARRGDGLDAWVSWMRARRLELGAAGERAAP